MNCSSDQTRQQFQISTVNRTRRPQREQRVQNVRHDLNVLVRLSLLQQAHRRRQARDYHAPQRAGELRDHLLQEHHDPL